MLKLYIGEEFTVQAEYDETDWLQVGKVVSWGSVLFPYLFSPYLREAELEEDYHSFKIGGTSTTKKCKVSIKSSKKNQGAKKKKWD